MFFVLWSAYNYNIINNKDYTQIKLKTLPIDPRDILSGNYFILNYSFSNVYQLKQQDYQYGNGKKYLVFKKDGENGEYYKEKYITSKKPTNLEDDEIYIVGTGRRPKYNIEKYFINESEKEPSREDKVDVVISINKNGYVRIKEIIVEKM